MTRATFKVLFYIKRTKELKDGTLPIYARITVNKQRAEFSLQKSIEKNQWDSHKGCAKGYSKSAEKLNSYLEFVRSKLYRQKYEFEERGKQITANNLKNNYQGIDKENRCVLEIFKEHNEKCKSLINIDFAQGTYDRYNTCYNHLERFIKYKYHKNDMTLNEVNQAFVKDFEFYLKTERKCGHNSSTKYLKNFKKITKIAIANSWLKVDPFSNIKFRLEEVDMDFLNEEELDKLICLDFKIERLQQVKDIYLFCCFTGLAFVDVKSLVYLDIDNRKGKLWIKKKRQKTKNWCHIPLLSPAVQIINKYRNHPLCIKTGRVLPVPSNQKMNAYLKEIADLCGINKNLSTHTARHTFATTVTLLNNIPIEVVSKMLGHSGLGMTRKYARVVDDLIEREMAKISTKYEDFVMH